MVWMLAGGDVAKINEVRMLNIWDAVIGVEYVLKNT